MKRHIASVSAGILALAGLAAGAQDLMYSGFMSDYTQLVAVTDGSDDYRYLVDDAENRLVKYNAIMIDQPEIFIANDSPYRGVKPKHLDALAESLRAGISTALQDDIYIVDTPGVNVLYLSVAISNLRLAKRKKSALSYLPVALVVGGISSAGNTDIAKKADFGGLVLEMEAFDSVSNERLAALITRLDPTEKGAESWEEVDALMAHYGRRIACRFKNSHRAEDEREDCLAVN